MSGSYLIHFAFLNEYNLIVEKHTGVIQLEVLVKFMNELSLKDEFSSKANFLIDLRPSKVSVDIEKVKEFNVFIRENFSSSLENKIAFIADESEQVAVATLFKILQPGVARNIHVFSTLEYALLWLNVDLKEQEMEAKINSSQSFVHSAP